MGTSLQLYTQVAHIKYKFLFSIALRFSNSQTSMLGLRILMHLNKSLSRQFSAMFDTKVPQNIVLKEDSEFYAFDFFVEVFSRICKNRTS